MQVPRWIACLMALTLVGVSNTMPAPNAQSGGDCEGYDHEGNVYNLASLKGRHGKPR